MVNEFTVVFMRQLVKQAAEYDLVSEDYVDGLEAMAEALKDLDPEMTTEEMQELIDATLLHAAKVN